MNALDSLPMCNNQTWVKNGTGEALYDVPTTVIVVLSVFYGSVSVIAVLGNGLVLWILCTSRKMRTTMNYFIGNLAVADIIIGVFSIPFQFQSALLQRWNLAHFMCPTSEFFGTLSVSVSVFTLTAIAADRYQAIVYRLINHQSRQRTKVAIATIWVLSISLALPQAIWLRVCNEYDAVLQQGKPYCDYLGVDDVSRDVYFYARVSCQYFIPLVVLSFCYCRVGCVMWGSRVPGNADNQRDAVLLNNKRKVLKMLVIVVVMFVICWLPFQLFYVILSIFPVVGRFRYINVIFFCAHWLAMANSCCNPFIYGIYNEKFKREFKNKFQNSVCHGRRYSMEAHSSEMENGSSTRTTMTHAMTCEPMKELEPLASRRSPAPLTGPD